MTQWLSGLSLLPTVMGIFGWIYSQGEVVLLALPGLREALWGGLIALGPICLVLLNLPWILARLPSNQLKAIAPELNRIMRQGPHQRHDLYWAKEKLTTLNIPCPKMVANDFDIPFVVPSEQKVWRPFLMQLVPIAEHGNIKKARQLVKPTTNQPADFAT